MASTETAPTGKAPTGTASRSYQGCRNGLTKTASTETAPTGKAQRDDGAKPKQPHLNLQAYIHGLDNIQNENRKFQRKSQEIGHNVV